MIEVMASRFESHPNHAPWAAISVDVSVRQEDEGALQFASLTSIHVDVHARAPRE